LILRDQLGPVMEGSLLVASVFAFFGAVSVTLATCSRVVFAMCQRPTAVAAMLRDAPPRLWRAPPRRPPSG
jgi:hypothetical protein